MPSSLPHSNINTTGTIQIYNKSKAGWSHQATILADNLAHDQRAIALSADGKTLVTLVVDTSSPYTTYLTQIYVKLGIKWEHEITLKDGGNAVALSENS